MLAIDVHATTPVGRIDGTIFADLNANASWDAGDGRNAGWTVYLDANNNAALDAGEIRRTTDANGNFSFPSLTPGNYFLRQVLQSGWQRTVPTSDDFLLLNVPAGRFVEASFGNTPVGGTVGAIAGTLWADLNDNGSWGAGDGRNAGWTVYVDANNNATHDGGELNAVTDVNGNYSINNLLPGTYIVREVLQAGWKRNVPITTDRWVLNVAAGQTATASFGNAPLPGTLAKITGTLWADLNNTGAWDTGDQRNVGWRVYIDGNSNAVFDTGETSALTDVNGNYSINNLLAGSYTVREVLPVGWRRISPSLTDRFELTLAPGQIGSATFGNSLIPANVGNIQGTLWSDLNDSGAWDAGDGRLAGWQVFLDANNNGAFDGGEKYQVSDQNGNYVFEYLPFGNYVLRQSIEPGWRRVMPVATDSWSVSLAVGQTLTTAFGNAIIPIGAQISGTLFADDNANNSFDDGDIRCVGWRVYVDANDNSAYDSGEITTLTDYNGHFLLAGLPAGTYKVRQLLLPGWRQTIPRNVDHYLFNLAPGGAGDVSFGNTQAVSVINGTAFNDANGNSIRDGAEAPLANWAVYIDENNNAKNDYFERWVTTNAAGNFAFPGLPGGSYRLRLIQHYGWTPTLGSQSSIAVVNGTSSVSGIAFGAKQNPEPATYAAERLVSWLLIGGSSTSAADRGVGWNIKAQGWTGFISQHVQPQIAWGVKRILLHNPFGAVPGEFYQADQAIEAREAGLNWLLDDFVQAWAPVIAQGIEVIAYMGAPANDDSFITLSDTAWWARLWDSFALPMAAGMNIGLDQSLASVPGDRDWTAVEQLRALGHDVYGEPRPPAAAGHWTSSPLLAEDWIWEDSNPELNPEEMNWAAMDAQISGEVTRIMTRPPAGQTWANQAQWMRAYTRSILRQGHSVSANLAGLVLQGVPMSAILS